MNQTRITVIAGMTTFSVFAILVSCISGQTVQPPQTIRLALTKTLVTDVPQALVDVVMDEFKTVVKKTTGLDSEVTAKFAAAEIAEKLQNKDLEFGLLWAHEFAQAQMRHPDLRPFLIAGTKRKEKRAHVIVHRDSDGKTIADLRGKKLDLPLTTKEYCRIYLEKVCTDKTSAGSAKFFGAIARSSSPLDALDEVARKKADATIIDSLWLDFYKDIKPGVFTKNLKVLQQSDLVPPAVIVYRPGTLGEATLDRVRDGLRKAHADDRGRALMAIWHIDAFEPVPKDYADRLAEVLKEYPPPNKPR
jgi:ABC-type phosphate/phosphonate transport system substrate-binding protein